MKKIFLFSFLFIAFAPALKATELANNSSLLSPPSDLVITVPWAEDTTRIDCASEIPDLIIPQVSSICGMLDTTRTIETTFGACVNKRFIKRTWTFRDNCLNVAQAIQIIIVDDIIPPDVIVPWAEDTLRIACNDDVPPLVYPIVSDNCGVKDTARTIETTFGACINKKFIKRTWRFRDYCDNETRAVQVIIVEDTIPPDVIVPWTEDTLRIACNDDVPPLVYPIVSDNCGVKDTARTIETTFGACINKKFIKRTWRFRDYCDNETRAVQVIIVEDTIPPDVIVPWAEDTLRIACNDDIPDIVYPAVTDNCGVKDTSRTIETTFGACINKKFIRRTWRFRDYCDNETKAVQVIIVEDTIPPDVIVPWVEDTLRIACNDDVPDIVYPIVTDNCGVKDTTRTVETTFGTCVNKKFIRRTWRFRDYCDNETKAVQVIIVDDNVPPTFSVPPDITIYTDAECNYDADVSITGDVTDETDNCSTGLEAEYSDVVDQSNPSMVTITRTWTLVDECDNVETQIQIITAEDNTPPEIYLEEDPIVLWPPNHKYVKINVENIVTDVWDNCSDVEVEHVLIVKVTSDEEENAIGNGDGNTQNDMKIVNDCKSVKLRKERSGNGNGRVYTIHMQLTDDNGNIGIGSYQVYVPHNKKRHAIDDGPIYEVIGDCDNKSFLFADQADEVDETRGVVITYPNPFTTSTTIEYGLNQPEKVTLRIYSQLGELIYHTEEIQPQGKQQLIWNAEENPSGIYYYRLQYGNENVSGTIVKVR